jgi:hypothetical protein
MAVSCSLNKSLTRENTCGYSLPEISEIFIANFNDVTAAPVDYDCESGVTVSAITMANSAVFYKIDPAKNSVTFSDELVVEDNGNKYRTVNLTFNPTGTYDACMRDVLDALSLGRYIGVVADGNGNWLMLGRIGGLEASTATLQGGGDTNGITVTLTANVTESAIPLSDDAIADVKGE